MPIYKAIASGNWTDPATWNEWNAGTSAWAAPFTAPSYPSTTSDTVYLNNQVPVVNIGTITTGIITNNASVGLAPNAVLGGRLSLTALGTPSPVTITASSNIEIASISNCSSVQGIIDASGKTSFTLTIISTAIKISVNVPLYTIGGSSTSTLRGATVTFDGSAGTSSRLLTSGSIQTVTLDAVTMTNTVADGLTLSAGNSSVTVTNNSNLKGSTTVTTYSINISGGATQTVTLEGGTYTAGTGSPCIFIVAGSANIVKVKNDTSAPTTSSAKIVNVNDWMAIWSPRIQIDNNITGWDFQPASTAGTTSLTPSIVSYPTTNNVRDGIVYGGGTGTLKVPPASTVLLGTPVDAGTGTLDIPNAVAQVVGNIVANLT